MGETLRTLRFIGFKIKKFFSGRQTLMSAQTLKLLSSPPKDVNMTGSANNNPQDSLNDSDKLDAMRDKVKSSPVSPNDREDDENAIDRLLLAEEFDLGESDQADDSEEYGIDDIDLSDEFDDDSKKLMFDEEQDVYDSFVDIIDDSEVDSSDDEIPSEIERFFEFNDSDEPEFEASDFEAVRPVARSGQAETLFENWDDNSFFADVDDARPAVRHAAMPEEKPEARASMLRPDLNKFMDRIRTRWSEKDRYDFGKDDMAEPGHFNSDQASISPHRLSAEFENKAKNTRFFAHLATGLGGIALIAALGFGLMAHGAKKEVSRLSELVNTREAAAGQGAVQSSDKELDDIRAAIEQLNQRVDGIVKQLSGGVSLSAEKETEIVQKQLNDLQARLYVLESKAPVVEAAESSAIRKEVVKRAAINKEIGKTAIASTKVKKTKLQKGAAEKGNTANDWTVNLIAYRQKWHAKNKAAEFEKKGIPVDIVDVKVGNVTWHRLTVAGFKNRSEAASYATKVKKTLKLTSVWVGNAQG